MDHYTVYSQGNAFSTLKYNKPGKLQDLINRLINGSLDPEQSFRNESITQEDKDNYEPDPSSVDIRSSVKKLFAIYPTIIIIQHKELWGNAGYNQSSVHYYTIDLNTFEEVKMQELFADNTKTQIEQVVKTVVRAGQWDYWESKVDLNDTYCTPAGLCFYEGRDGGVPDIVVPWSQLNGLLSPKGKEFLASMAGL
jgi:hypothetical protein